MSFTFGAKTTQAPTFGSQPAGSITFGTPVAQTGPRFGLSGSTFGQTSTPSTGFQLGAATTTQSNLFGTPATATSAAPLFGTPAAKPLAFGTPAATTASTGFSFGTSTLGAPATGLGFGTPASTGLSFGAPAPTSASTGFSLGTPASSAGLSFGTQTTQSGGLFGTPALSTGLNFGGTSTGLNLSSAATSAPTLGLSFGGATTTPTLSFGATPASAPSTGLSFNFASPATTASTLFSGLGGLKPTTAVATTATTSAAAVSVGLGGVTTQQQQPAAAKAEIAPKEQPLPNEIMQTVEQFKNFIKDQKTYSSEVSRCCVKEYWKVEDELVTLRKIVDDFEVELQKNRALAEKLKQDTAKGLQDADMAQRTFNTPPGMQYDHVEPTKFFTELADEFERKVLEIKRQIEATNSHLRYLLNPTPLSPEDLAVGMKRLHESFIALAGGLQTIHNQVELQKEQYLNFRKYTFNENKNVFANASLEGTSSDPIQRSANYLPPKIEFGPTPFNSITSTSFALNNLQNQPPSYPGSTPLAVSTSAPSFGTQSSLFGSSSLFGNTSFQFNSPSYNFQLQKPPVGNKRGKQ